MSALGDDSIPGHPLSNLGFIVAAHAGHIVAECGRVADQHNSERCVHTLEVAETHTELVCAVLQTEPDIRGSLQVPAMTDDVFDQTDKLAMTAIAVRHGDAATIGLQDAPQLADRGCAIVNVVEHVRREDNVERGVAKRQLLHVTTDDGTACALVRGADHPDRCIESHGLDEREVAAVPAADFEDAIAVVNIGKVQHPREQLKRRLPRADFPQELPCAQVRLGRILGRRVGIHDPIRLQDTIVDGAHNACSGVFSPPAPERPLTTSERRACTLSRRTIATGASAVRLAAVR